MKFHIQYHQLQNHQNHPEKDHDHRDVLQNAVSFLVQKVALIILIVGMVQPYHSNVLMVCFLMKKWCTVIMNIMLIVESDQDYHQVCIFKLKLYLKRFTCIKILKFTDKNLKCFYFNSYLIFYYNKAKIKQISNINKKK